MRNLGKGPEGLNELVNLDPGTLREVINQRLEELEGYLPVQWTVLL